MPSRPLKACNKVGCRTLTREKYCEEHKQQPKLDDAKYRQENKEKIRQKNSRYDRYDRNQEAKTFYKSSKWLNMRERILSRDNRLCQYCFKQGTLTPGNIVHHMVELNDNWDRRLDELNLTTVCDECHNNIHSSYHIKGNGKYQQLDTQVYVVCGAPGSGKTTLAQENRIDGDLVLDLDLMWIALTGLDMYEKPEHLLPIVLAAKESIIKEVEKRVLYQFPVRAWILTTNRNEARDLTKRLKAQLVMMDATKEQCTERVHQDERRQQHLVDHIKLINRWFKESEMKK